MSESESSIETLDLTPTWRSTVPRLIAIITAGDYEARNIARDEMYRMAEMADKYVEIVMEQYNENY